MAKSKRTKQWDWQSIRYADLGPLETGVCPRRSGTIGKISIDTLFGLVESSKLRGWMIGTKSNQVPLRRMVGLLTSLFSHHWKPCLFGRTPNGFWKNRKNRVQYLRWLEKQLGCRKPEDWYAIQTSDFIENHGKGLSDGTRLLAIVKDLYPRLA